MPKHIKKEEDYEPSLRLIGEVAGPDVLWRKAKPLDLRPKSEGETSKDYVIRHFGVNSVGDRYEVLRWRGAPNTNCYRYWNTNGSYFEKLPDHSEYFLRVNGQEKLKTRAGAGWERRAHRPKVYFNAHLLPEDLKKEERNMTE
ncbi:hypothetical protein FS837_011483 [Tulasnella sp. UAMH 9824]|nr:hypothetical protein FS837_011483 [Tulasnella sp. UAMH 9824]